MQVSLSIKSGCVVACITDADVKTTPDKRGLGAIVDATVVESKKR